MTLIYILISFPFVFMAAGFIYLIWYNLYWKRRINDQSDKSGKYANQRDNSDESVLNTIIIAETRTGRQCMFIEPALDISKDTQFIVSDSKHDKRTLKPLITVE